MLFLTFFYFLICAKFWRQNPKCSRPLKEAGFSAKELKGARFSAKDLKGAGFSSKELGAAGFRSDDIMAAFNLRKRQMVDNDRANRIGQRVFCEGKLRQLRKLYHFSLPVNWEFFNLK